MLSVRVKWSSLRFTLTSVRRKRLDKYAEIRQTLMKMSLINQTKETDCGLEWSDNWRCNFDVSTHFCTSQVG